MASGWANSSSFIPRYCTLGIRVEVVASAPPWHSPMDANRERMAEWYGRAKAVALVDGNMAKLLAMAHGLEPGLSNDVLNTA